MSFSNKPLVFIPARAGSKSIIDKNIQEINNIPLLLNAISTSITAGFTPIVSSDSPLYISLAKSCPECLSHARQEKDALDDSDVWDAVTDYCSNIDISSNTIILLLEPTSPFVTSDDIHQMLKLMSNLKSCEYASNLSAVPATQSYINQRSLSNDQYAEFIFSDRYRIKFKQESEQPYCFGNLHAIRASFLKHRNIPSKMPYKLIPFIRSISIDSQEDLCIARAIATSNNKDVAKKFQRIKRYLNSIEDNLSAIGFNLNLS